MNKASPSLERSSSARRNRTFSAVVEGLEARAYLSGVAFGTPVNTRAAAVGAAPVYAQVVSLPNSNLNGDVDLVTSNVATGAVPNSVSILTNNGYGSFSQAQTFPVSFSPATIADGALVNNYSSIVVGSSNNNSIELLTSDSTGTFTAQTLTAPGLTNTRSVTLGYFFGDGHEDIAVASFDGRSRNNLAIFRNNGDDTFTDVQTLSVPHARLSSIISFQQSNGTTDLAVTDELANKVTVLVNDGSGNFSVGQDYRVGNKPIAIVAGEFNYNDDQRTDLVTASATSGSVTVLLGNGDQTFTGSKTSTLSGVPKGGGLLNLQFALLNSDFPPDVDLFGGLSPGSAGSAEVLLGNGDGTFHVGSIIRSSGGAMTAIAAGHLTNSSPYWDILLANTTQVTTLPNVTNQDHTPPTATVSPAILTRAGSGTIQFVVNYGDDTQIDATTLNSGNITVTDPSGNPRPVTLVSSSPANGPTLSATYSIPASGGSLGAGDNGTYTVTATSGASTAVKDANGNALAGGSLGTFTVAVDTGAANLVAEPVKVQFPLSLVPGATRISRVSVPVLNSGDALAAGQIVINLYANTDPSTVDGATLVRSITRHIRLRSGAQTTFTFPAFTWPAGLIGNYFLVAQVNATNSVAEATLADNISASATAASIAAPLVGQQN